MIGVGVANSFLVIQGPLSWVWKEHPNKLQYLWINWTGIKSFLWRRFKLSGTIINFYCTIAILFLIVLTFNFLIGCSHTRRLRSKIQSDRHVQRRVTAFKVQEQFFTRISDDLTLEGSLSNILSCSIANSKDFQLMDSFRRSIFLVGISTFLIQSSLTTRLFSV